MSLANFSSTFLDFEMRHEAQIPGEATYDASGASSKSNAVDWPRSRQSVYSQHTPRGDYRRHFRSLATITEFLQTLRGLARRFRRARGWPFRQLGCVLVFATNTAMAEGNPTRCIQAHGSAQELRSSGRLVEALKLFDSCGANDCPKLIQKDCKLMGRAVEKILPTLSLTALAQDGHALANYRIELEGVVLPPEASRQPIPVDPGIRHIKLVVSGRPIAEVTIPVRNQEKNQSVTIQVATPDPAVSKVRTASYVLAGIGAVGLASFVGFGISGYLDQRKLDTTSVHADDRDDLKLVDRMRRKYVIADVSLGIGLVSFGAATYLWHVTQTSKSHALVGTTTAVFLRSSTDGGTISLRTAF